MDVYMIRHGATPGNREKRYVGRTDEPLSEEGRHALIHDREQGRYAGIAVNEEKPESVDEKQFQSAAVNEELPESVNAAQEPPVLFVSPMLRCRETADILFPGIRQIVVPGLQECDFGGFEYRNYIEMKDDPLYSQWVERGGRDPFPDGEDPEEFRRRSVRAFLEALRHPESDVVFVVHGGTIMAVMEALVRPEKDYFDWQVPNGGGVVCRWEPDQERCMRYLRNL